MAALERPYLKLLCRCTSDYAAAAAGVVLKEAEEAKAKAMHAYTIQRGGGSSYWVGVVKAYAKCGCVAEARRVVEGMPTGKGIVVAFTALITVFAGQGFMERANEVFEGLFSLSLAETDVDVDVVAWNAMIAGYAHNAQMEKAAELFGRMQPETRNVVTWTAMISGYVHNGSAHHALDLFYEMPMQMPNHFTFAAILPACQHVETLEEIHQQIIQRGLQSNVFVGNGLVHMYAKLGKIEVAREVFDKMAQPNVVSWTAIAAAYTRVDVEEALRLFWRIPQRNVASWNAMIGGCMQHGHVHQALRLFQQMPQTNAVSWNTMIAGYAQSGQTDKALELFQQMPKTSVTVVSWNAVIAGYAYTEEAGEALRVFRLMQMAGEVKPNSQTFALVLPLYAKLAALKQGKEIHGAIIRLGVEGNVYVSSAVVDMYAKCGSIENACAVFEQMREGKRDVVSWSSMIMGFAMHGLGREAVQVFERMQQCGVRPDHVTLVGVLWACAQAGLVEEGCHYFQCITTQYEMTPTMEHYGCMVDLLGRAGRLHQAHHFITHMPIKADATVWASLLGACKTYSNIELGEFVAQQLFQLNPQNPAAYVNLSNIYAATGRWDGIEEVRKIMKVMRLTKTPGCSWIVVNKQMHAFVC